MSDKQFEIGGRQFELRKINAIKQFHIARRIAPILADLLPSMKGMGKLKDVGAIDKLSEDEKLDQIGKFVGPVMGGLSKLSDADADLVLYGLLQSVQVRQVAGNWTNVATETGLMIQDLDMSVLLQLAGRSFLYNLSGFFTALPRQS